MTEDVKLDVSYLGYNGVTFFDGFVIPATANTFTPPERKIRKLEYIGDSDLMGFGLDGSYDNDNCLSEEHLVSNNYDNFGS